MLITGEPGTGKSELARYVHGHSSRATGPLVYGTCAAMSAGDAAVDLFGMERPKDDEPSAGAASAIGLVESAAGGTLVLEDVHLLDPYAQAALAETLAEGSFRRVGSQHRIETETRFIATAGADLPAAVRAGSFRADLFESLAKISIALPPLRERSVDIAMLAQAFVREFGGSRGPALASEALDALQNYAWPGNLRELRNVLERAVLLAEGGIIHAHDLPLPAAARPGAAAVDEPLSLDEVERRHIAAVLQHANWHQGKAASLLGISAKTLYRKIREYGFERPAGARSPMRVLVIEDDPTVGQFVKRGLEEQRWSVDLVADGEEGESLARSQPYDLVVLDMRLPGRSGSTCCATCGRTDSSGPCSCSPRRTPSTRRSRRCAPAPTTTSPSRSPSRNCSRASRRSRAVRACSPRRC